MNSDTVVIDASSPQQAIYHCMVQHGTEISASSSLQLDLRHGRIYAFIICTAAVVKLTIMFILAINCEASTATLLSPPVQFTLCVFLNKECTFYNVVLLKLLHETMAKLN